MPEVKLTDLAWYPPPFPAQGRLPREAYPVLKNLEQQRRLEQTHYDNLILAAGRRLPRPCCKTVHISLFFDGTGNNLNNDLYLSGTPHPTNVARLFRATIGAGYAGGTAHGDSKAHGLTDTLDVGNNQYFKYYMPGVGTPFPEIGDLDYGLLGMAAARYGEERINWGLLMIVDALRRMADLPSLDVPALKEAVEAMTPSMLQFGAGGAGMRQRGFQRQLAEPQLAARLRTALLQPTPGTSKLLGLKLYVYGFSRGAAAARAFVNWLAQLLHHPAPDATGNAQPAEHCLMVGDLKLPLTVEFLGLFDTVASVGVAHLAPVAEGHMSWADGTQELPEEKTYGSWIKRCLHLVASHEQRLCFPLESVRRTTGHYPSCAVEVIHPGVHSDLGGGYPPGDQGKGYSEGNAQGDGLLLSQIALHAMYADAFAQGAPLKVPMEALTKELSRDRWRVMEFGLQKEFDVAPDLVDRFNAWRQLTLNLPSDPQPLPASLADHYQPVRAACSLETALQAQMGWLTAWRIDRYAFMSMEGKQFYEAATDTESGEQERKQAKDRQVAAQADVEARRQKQLEMEDDPRRPSRPLEPGPKDFDPDMGKTQLRQAAQEFGEDYRGTRRGSGGDYEWALDSLPLQTLYLINSDDELDEYQRMKAAGRQHVSELFPPPRGKVNHQNEHDRGPVDESLNASQASGLLRALFDDQVHDSRAWFLHNALGGSREPWSSYFRERMVYFGEAQNKQLSLLSVAGGIVGAAVITGAVVMVFRQKNLADQLALAGALSQVDVQRIAGLISVLDKRTGLPLPMLANAAELRAPTDRLGTLAQQQRQAIGALRIAQAQRAIDARWAAHDAQAKEARNAQV